MSNFLILLEKLRFETMIVSLLMDVICNCVKAASMNEKFDTRNLEVYLKVRHPNIPTAISRYYPTFESVFKS